MNLNDLERAILGDVWTASALWDSLTYLCDECSGRLTGSEDQERAGDYLLQHFRDFGLENVASEPFDVPIWTRGKTHLILNSEGSPHELYGMAVVLSPGAEVHGLIIDVGPGNDSDFEQSGDNIKGNIVLTGPEGPNRLEKYVRAQQAGAAALLLGGGAPGMVIPAGSLGLRSAKPQIPAISLAQESTAYLQRRLQAGAVTAHLSVTASLRPGTARNITAELPGSLPEEGWIIACGHYDGHDIGQGAQDNGTGTAVILEAARVLAPLRAQLKAGIKFVLFAGEDVLSS